ncbi:hypothetical protein SAMN02787142_7800 [Burkholderia sp. WP9]|uniref:hypothetical protein n=1 Tax=Burkholderia sp. WP9 TaxID=1500263 RepID=UPI000894E21D|nr:hypothetical protein [Burkholderia sp. WP9]SEF11937.1 hypothetical protein SAMN02787142_7800 [Burkholderia sp. WP9]
MAVTSEQLRKYRRFFRIALFVSVVASIASFLWFIGTAGPSSDGTIVVSGAAVLVSLIGLVITTVTNWRRDKRDALRDKLEMERIRLENERLRRDLANSAAQTTERDGTS